MLPAPGCGFWKTRECSLGAHTLLPSLLPPSGLLLLIEYASPGLPVLTSPSSAAPLLACSQKLDGPYDNRVLPVVLTCVLMTFLTVVWIGSIVRCCKGGAACWEWEVGGRRLAPPLDCRVEAC